MFVQLEIQTRNKVDLVDITEKIKEVITDHQVEEGMCFLFCPHTTAGIVLNENWDPSVRKDVAMALKHIVPDSLHYDHAEGNSPAHIKSILVGNDHAIIIRQHKLMLGTWQGVFLTEFDGPRKRKVWVKLISESTSG